MVDGYSGIEYVLPNKALHWHIELLPSLSRLARSLVVGMLKHGIANVAHSSHAISSDYFLPLFFGLPFADS